MTQTATLAVAADYADAMLVARRAKNWLFLLLLLCLLVQIGIFLLARFVPNVHLTATLQTSAGSTATTQVAMLSDTTGGERTAAPFIQFITGIIDFAGIAIVIVLAVVLLLIVTIMLVGRLVGVTHVTSAFVWCVLLAMLLFPWQTLLNSDARIIRLHADWRGHHAGDVIATDHSAAAALVDAGVAENAAGSATTTVSDVRFPGVLYTWPELMRDYDFSNSNTKLAFLKWARFVGFPVIAIIVLMTVQARSSRGLRYALGESEMQVQLTHPAR